MSTDSSTSPSPKALGGSVEPAALASGGSKQAVVKEHPSHEDRPKGSDVRIDAAQARASPTPALHRPAEPGAAIASKPGPQRRPRDDDPQPKRDPLYDRADVIAKIEASLVDRYVIKRAPIQVGPATVGQTEYRFRGDTSRIAFTESTFRLATETNSPSVARSMVDVAETRNWTALRVSGNDEFRRLVWLEASTRGVRTLGYEPNLGDMEALRRAREARLINRIEPDHGTTPKPPPGPTATSGGGRKAVLAAIEAVLIAKRVPEAKRAAVLASATEKLAERTRDGQVPKIKVYDKAAPSKRPVPAPAVDHQRPRERAPSAPTR